MKPKQLLILVAVLAALGLVAFLASRPGGSGSAPDTAELRGQKVLQDWPINDIESIQVKSPDSEVNLTKTNNLWVVGDRKDYPADPSKVSTLLVKLWATPVVQAFEAGASQNERLSLLEPDAEAGDDEKKATKITFKGKGGSELGHVLIGKNNPPQSSPGQNPMAGGGGKSSRFLRTSKSADIVLEVADNFSEDFSGSGWPYSFSSIEAEPGGWLNKEDFIAVKKVKAIEVTQKEEGKQSFSLSRESDTGDFVLAGDIAEGKELDASKVSSLKTILSSASFEDLLTEEEAKAIDLEKTAEAKITTFEGFSYTITLGPKDDEDNQIPIKFTVDANFPTERTVEEGKEETEEEKKTADADFQTKLAENQEKLTKEQALSGHWFSLSSYRVDALAKSREELLKDQNSEEDEVTKTTVLPQGVAPTPTITPAKPDELPPGIIVNEDGKYEAVTPPIAVPPFEPKEADDGKKIEVASPPVPAPAAEEAKDEGSN